MQVVVLNGALTEAEQDAYVRQVTAVYPVSIIENCFWTYRTAAWMSAVISTVFATCGRWAATASGSRPAGTMPSRRNFGIQFPIQLTDKLFESA